MSRLTPQEVSDLATCVSDIASSDPEAALVILQALACVLVHQGAGKEAWVNLCEDVWWRAERKWSAADEADRRRTH